MYKTGNAFSSLLLKDNVDNDVINVSLFARPVCVVNHAIDQWRRRLSRPVSTYDCYSQNNNGEMAAL